MALLFTGISKIANDVLLNNPMGNHMAETIFTRVLGSSEIEHGEVWKDTSQCWICDKWNKTRIEFEDDDIEVLKQNIQRVQDLDEVVAKCCDSKYKHMLE